MARGVWSGVGDSESWEKVGDDGAVELGEPGLERLTRGPLESWPSCECDLDIDELMA